MFSSAQKILPTKPVLAIVHLWSYKFAVKPKGVSRK